MFCENTKVSYENSFIFDISISIRFFFVPVKKCLAKDIQLRKGLWFKKEYSYSCWDDTVVTGHKTFAVGKQTTKQKKTHFVLHIQFWIPVYKMAQTTFRVRLCCSVKPSC